MKKYIRIICFCLVLVSILSILSACGNTFTDSPKETTAEIVEIKESPDKYTWYIKNYVGLNCAAFGKTSWDGYRYEEYGRGRIKFVFLADDNSFVDPEEKDSLKNYVVTAQSAAPNTELRLVFEKNSEGEEYENLVESQNIYEIVLHVKCIADNSSTTE